MISFGRSFFGQFLESVVVDGLRFLRYAVGNDLVSLAGKIQMMPVRKVAAVSQIQSKNCVAGLQHRCIGLHVGLRSGVGLHVGVFGAE